MNLQRTPTVESYCPADTRRKNNVILTSKRRRVYNCVVCPLGGLLLCVGVSAKYGECSSTVHIPTMLYSHIAVARHTVLLLIARRWRVGFSGCGWQRVTEWTMWTASHWERRCGLCDNRDPSPLQCSNNTLSKYIFSCDQAALRMAISVCLSVCPSVCLCPSVCDTFLTMFPSSYHHENFRSYYQWPKWCPCRRSRSEVKGQGHRDQNPT